MVANIMNEYSCALPQSANLQTADFFITMNTYSCELPKRQIKITKTTQISIFKTNSSNKKRGQMAIYQALSIVIST